MSFSRKSGSWREDLKKRTIKKDIVFEGIGLHTGEISQIRLLPSNRGRIVFVKGKDSFPANYKFVIETKRGVVLGNERFTVFTVEHLLSSLYGMGVDSVDIVFEKGNEPPALDGSALEFATKIREAGLLEIDKEITSLEGIQTEYSQNGVLITLQEGKENSITYFIDFPAPIGNQIFTAPLNDPEFYFKNIAPARTFIFDFEVEKVKSMGLAKGGSIENTVVFTDKGVYNGTLRFKDEPVRHKILDFIGDIALLGKRIKGSILVKKAGHTEHIEFIKKLEETHGI